MPLIVEDGTMPEGANTYASVADADAYLLSRGVSGWPRRRLPIWSQIRSFQLKKPLSSVPPITSTV